MGKKVYTTENSQEALTKVLDKFQNEDSLEFIERGIKFQVPDIFPSANYSLWNRILLYLQADSLVAGTYNFWKKNGRYVNGKGKQAYIYAPLFKKWTEEKELPDGSKKEVKRQYLYGFRPIPVYPIEATDINKNFEGEPIQLPDLAPAELPPLLEIAKEALDMPIEFKPVPPDRLGDMIPSERINLGTDDPRVFYHELAHELHARTDPKFKERSKTYKETVAEFCGSVLMRMYEGKDSSGNAWEYIKMFAEDPMEAVGEAMYHIEKALDLLEELTEEVA